MEKNIKIEDVVAFFEEAMKNNLECWSHRYSGKSITSFGVSCNDCSIGVTFYKDGYIISGIHHEYIEIKHELTEREKLTLDQLFLLIKEYNEERALNMFKDFFRKNPVDIDLDNDDDD